MRVGIWTNLFGSCALFQVRVHGTMRRCGREIFRGYFIFYIVMIGSSINFHAIHFALLLLHSPVRMQEWGSSRRNAERGGCVCQISRKKPLLRCTVQCY